MLNEALTEYREREMAGGDMVQAGQELASRVEDILEEPICGMPREWVLREILQPADDGGYQDDQADVRPRVIADDEPTDAADEQTDFPLDDYGYPEYRP